MFARKQVRYIGLLMFAYLFTACSWLNQPSDEVSQHRQQWTDQNLASYSYTIQVSCFCLTDLTQPVRVEVRDGAPASLTSVETGDPVTPELFAEFDTVDDLFALIRNAKEQNYSRVEVEYDEQRGFPTSIALDGSEQMADDETFYTISNFEALQ